MISETHVLLIDNYDSFTYNLVQLFGTLGAQVEVVLNDQISIEEIEAKKPSHLCVSPGPGSPQDAGISKTVIQRLGGVIPILGVCLGHQCIVDVFGGRILSAPQILHGKTSWIFHDQTFPFQKMPKPFQAMRYHSLIGEMASLPPCLKAQAWTEQQELMAVAHQELPIWGVQFHPESVLTPEGTHLLETFLNHRM